VQRGQNPTFVDDWNAYCTEEVKGSGRLQREGREAINEDRIFSAYARMREVADTARRTTKAARREAQRRRYHRNVKIAAAGGSANHPSDVVTDLAQIEPFEIEELR
jgi:hypothetical protein